MIMCFFVQDMNSVHEKVDKFFQMWPEGVIHINITCFDPAPVYCLTCYKQDPALLHEIPISGKEV